MAQFTDIENIVKSYHWKRVSITDQGQTGDRELVRRLEDVGVDVIPKILAYLNNKTDAKNGGGSARVLTVKDPEADREIVPGLWRLVSNREVPTTPDGGEQVIEQTLRLGYSETVKWDEARLLGEVAGPSNASEVAGISGTTSDNENRRVEVLFPNLNPFKLTAFVASLNATSFNVTVGGEALGALHKITARTGRSEEDGSGWCIVTMAAPQYTLNAYENAGTSREASRHYLWGVPKDIAQTILNDWKAGGDGRTASATHDGELVNLVLSANNPQDTNLDISDVWINCDTKESYSFAKGYTKENIDTWITDNHSAVLGEGITRRIELNERGDGLWDALVTTKTFGPHDSPYTPDLSIVCTTGTGITQKKDFGWNFRKSEVSSDNIKDLYDQTAKAVGVSSDFRVTREDDCSYDWSAEIITRGAFEETVTIEDGSDDIKTVAYVGRNVTASEVAAVEAAYTPGPRKRHSVNIQANDDDTLSLLLSETSIPKVEGGVTITKGASQGFGVLVKSGKSVDAAELSALASAYPSTARKQTTISVSGNEDNTFDYELRQSEVQKVQAEADASIDAETQGTGVLVKSGKNVDPADLATIISGFGPSARKRVQIDISPNDDGTLDYKVFESEVQKVQAVADTGTAVAGGVRVKVASGSNVDPADLTTILAGYTTGVRKRTSISLRGNDDGTLDYDITEQTVQSVSGSKSVADSTIYYGSNVSSDSLPDVTTLDNVIQSASFKGNDDGTIDYSITLRPRHDLDYEASDTAPANKKHVQVGVNQVAVPTTFTGDRLLSAFVQPGENGRWNYTIISEDLDTTTISTAIEYGTALKTVSFTAAKDDTNEPSDGSVAQGVTSRVSVRITPDGKFDWNKEEETATAHNVTASGGQKSGYLTVTVNVQAFVNQTSIPADVPTSDGETVSFQGVRINDDQTYDYIKVTTTVAISGGGTYVIERGKATEIDRQVVYSKYFPSSGLYRSVIVVWKRYVYNQKTRTYSLSHPSATTSSNNTTDKVSEIGNGVFVKDTQTVIEGDWALTNTYKKAVTFDDIENAPSDIIVPPGGW